MKRVVRTAMIKADPDLVFHCLRHPEWHCIIDGSGTVRRVLGASEIPVELGSAFRMSMRIGYPYMVTNRVVELDHAERLVAWRHFAGHTWRYRVEANDSAQLVSAEGAGDGSSGRSWSRVRGEFDYSTEAVPGLCRLLGWPVRNARFLDLTLEALSNALTDT